MKQNHSNDRLHLLLCAAMLILASAIHMLIPANEEEPGVVQVFLTVGGYDQEVPGTVKEVAAEPYTEAVEALLREPADAR